MLKTREELEEAIRRYGAALEGIAYDESAWVLSEVASDQWIDFVPNVNTLASMLIRCACYSYGSLSWRF